MNKEKQTTNTIMMIRPVSFRLNEQTKGNNHYQQNIEEIEENELQNNALIEFDHFVKKLKENNIEVIVFDDTLDTDTPDSIFPNNWISFHENGTLVKYPMYAKNRRQERRQDIIDYFNENYEVENIIDLTPYELENQFLEGTGSMLLDRTNKIVYACKSERTDIEVLNQFCHKMGYKAVCFDAKQTIGNKRMSIYHTNVMMCVADAYVIICIQCIDDKNERLSVVNSIKNTGKEIIEISESQKQCFAGNMLQVTSSTSQPFLVMSSSAYNSLTEKQLKKIKKYNPIINSPIKTIETLGGGSARCMMAEVFLKKK